MIDFSSPPEAPAIALARPAIIMPSRRVVTPAELRGIRTDPPIGAPLLGAFGTAAGQGSRRDHDASWTHGWTVSASPGNSALDAAADLGKPFPGRLLVAAICGYDNDSPNDDTFTVAATINGAPMSVLRQQTFAGGAYNSSFASILTLVEEESADNTEIAIQVTGFSGTMDFLEGRFEILKNINPAALASNAAAGDTVSINTTGATYALACWSRGTAGCTPPPSGGGSLVSVMSYGNYAAYRDAAPPGGATNYTLTNAAAAVAACWKHS